MKWPCWLVGHRWRIVIEAEWRDPQPRFVEAFAPYYRLPREWHQGYDQCERCGLVRESGMWMQAELRRVLNA